MHIRIGVFGINEEVLRLAELLKTNPNAQIVRYWTADKDAARTQAIRVGGDVAAHLERHMTEDMNAFLADGNLDAVVDSGSGPSFLSVFPDAGGGRLQILRPLTARLLWAYGDVGQDRKSELLQALAEVVESVDLAIDTDELFVRMLDIAVGATGADGGSLMLLDDDLQELRIRVAHGVERELWSKIRVPLGEGIAGRVAADARSLLLRGRADASKFQILRRRSDIESAICVPLVVQGRILGVLNLHHNTQTDAFDQSDLEFLEKLAALDAQIIDRAQEHESLRNQAARFSGVREVQTLLATAKPILERLQDFCRLMADRVGDGIATVYLRDDLTQDLSLAATSLSGGGFAGEYQIARGEGVDGRVAQSGNPDFLRDAEGAVAYLCLPLCAGDELVGVLSVQVGTTPPRGRAEEEILFEMAAALGEGIARTEREAQLAVRATRASAINEAGVRMISAEDLNDVARLATSSGAMIMEAEHAVIRLQDPQTLRYVIRSYFGPADGRQQEKLFRFDKKVCVESIRRRGPMILRDIVHGTSTDGENNGIRSLLAAPLKREGKVVGTFAIYDKVAPERFHAIDFNEEDLKSFRRLVTYVERAVDNAMFHALARQHRNFDPQTGLPNATYLQKRIHQEVSRAGGQHGALALATCVIENIDEIQREANPAQVHRVILGTADALRAKLRDFDVLGRTDRGGFTILLPDPGIAADQRIAELANAVGDLVCKNENLNTPVRIALAFGYAVYPGDGADPDTLLASASTPRIHLL
jgi:GAF domain-containing protein